MESGSKNIKHRNKKLNLQHMLTKISKHRNKQLKLQYIDDNQNQNNVKESYILITESTHLKF